MNPIWRFLNRITGLQVGLLATAVAILIYFSSFTPYKIPFIDEFDLKAYDFHLRTRGPVTPTGEVAIVAIDEKSLDALGKWPWPRTRMAELIRKLSAMDPSVIALDIVFSEPDESSGAVVLRKLRQEFGNSDPRLASLVKKAEAKADNDRILSNALSEAPMVLGYFFFTGDEVSAPEDRQKETYLIPSRFASVRQISEAEPRFKVLDASGVARNIPVIASSAESFGYFNIAPDMDGTVRWVDLVIKYGDEYYPHISIESLRRYADFPNLILNVADYGVDSINIGDVIVPTDEHGRLLVNFRGGPHTFPHYSAADIVEGAVPREAIEGKIIIIGATAIGIYDMRVTPFSGVFPGVEILANTIDTIISGDFIYRPEWIYVYDLLSILIPGVLLSLVIPRVSALFTALFTIVMATVYIYANHYVFVHLKLWLTDIYPVFTIIFVSSSTTVFQFVSEQRKKKEIREAFSRYVDRSVVNEIVKNPGLLNLGGEEKVLTVLFSDVRGFTNITEKLIPQALVKLMNDYLTPMTEVILKNGGTVDKYMGDAIMAFWGAPLPQADHAIRACKAALEMERRLIETQTTWDKPGIPRLVSGIGLSTGKAVVGNMGSSTRFDYTVMGDVVNLGSRLEGLTKEYGVRIIVPKPTYEEVKDFFVFRELDLVKVKGKDIPIAIYELMGYAGEPRIKEIAEVFEAGLKAYRAMAWTVAVEYFDSCLELKPDDGPSKAFLKRIELLRAVALPAEWDGVFVMKTK
ncbi:MAG: adenylate/guanylate cyclase domain-containing protein [Deltaproteobacteria bacterium]|nr:adenylate/guanylate cyclase domain-containing protein [Deltaproteobacteria bacterium]